MIFDKDYYNKDYFVTPEGKKITLKDGTEKKWSYANSTGDWHGTLPIVKAWKKVFNPQNMLDVGAGRGVFMGYAQKIGIKARGFDFSDFAVNRGLFSQCEAGTLIQHDATEPWPYKDGEFDFTICLDLIEHIYEDDISFVLNELFRTNNKYIFLQIATTNGLDYSLKKGEETPEEIKTSTLTGHVHMRHQDWWIRKLQRTGWHVNQEKVDEFFKAIEPPDLLAPDCAWRTNLLTCLEKDA